MEHDAGPQENFVGAPAGAGVNGLAQGFGFRRIPEFREAGLAEIAQRRVGLAEADVAVGIDHGAHAAGAARDDLALFDGGLHLCPLQHGFDDTAEAVLFARRPHGLDVAVELAIVVERRADERRILAVATDEGQVMVIHRRTVFVEIAGEFGDLAHIF